MKKSVLVTSILFSTMMLGSSIFDETHVMAKMEDSTELQGENSVKNIIRFVNQDMIPLDRYHDSEYTFTGKVGDDINIESVIPAGYQLHDKEQHLKIQNSDEVRVVVLDAQEVTNKVYFKDVKNKKILESVTLTGKVGDVYRFPNEKLPDGYHYEIDSNTDDITLSAVEKEIDIWIVENKKEKNVKLKFVDKDGKYISEKDVKCTIGEFFYLPTGLIFDAHFLSGYVLENNQPISLAVKEDTEVIEVKVKRIFMRNVLDFKDGDDIVESVVIDGNLGSKKNINEFIPNDYDLINPDDSSVVIENQGSHKEIKVKRTAVTNTLKFMDENGTTIKSTIVEGKIGHKKRIDDLVPDEYDLVNPDDINIVIGASGVKREIKIKKNTVKNTIQFKDSKGNIVDSVDAEGKKGSDRSIYFILPKGFSLKDKEKWTFKFGNDGSTILVNVVKNVQNKVQYITSDGNEIGIDYAEGTVGEDISLRIPKGYTLISSKVINFNSIEGYIHKVVLKGRKLDTKLIFKDVRYPHQDKFILEKLFSGRVGDKIPNDMIPHGYVLSNRNILEYEVPNEVVWVKKKVNLVINYIDSFGRIVGSQKSTNLDKEIVNLSAPKGYLVVNNQIGEIEVNQEHPVQNVLVVPTNGIQQPELPNIVSTQINFIDRKNNKVIHSYVVQGQHGQSHSIQVPEGYDLAKGVTNKLTLDKSKKLINIYMVEKESINTNGVIVSHSKTVLTKQTANLYDKNGKRITNRALGHSSGWKSDQKMVLNGVTYYRVATNEYVRASDIVEYEPAVSVISTTNGSAKYLYDIHGKRSSNRALSSNTAWFTDKLAIINGEKMYRVATNEWVKASDIK
ncbi:SLAP domain-containing protein [Companilactobacillus zhachilii]|uniref:SLAP domain-containing protein n=1 Tax=Companilactobacillus zhachilii TaxID=2304606 RepID=UPI0040333149